MPVEPIHYMLNSSPLWTWILNSSMIGSGGWALWRMAKTILKNARARRMLAAGLDLDDDERKNIGKDENVNAVVLEMLRRMEIDRREQMAQGERRWERIEEMVGQMREQAEIARQHTASLNGTIQAIQNFATYMDQTHRYQSQQIDEVKQNQIRLQDWLRDRSNLWSHPPFRQGRG